MKQTSSIKISILFAALFATRVVAVSADPGNETQVNQTTSSNQASPAIGSAPDGSSIVVWSGPAPGTINADIFARRYAADGTPSADEFNVTNNVTAQDGPAVAYDAAGNYVIAWYSQESETSLQVRYRRFSSSGVPLTNESRVSTSTAYQRDPDIAMNADGEFMVVWSEQIGSDNNIVARRFAADGSPIGEAFLVNQQTEGSQQFASVAMDDTGNAVVVWQTEAETEGGVSARLYSFLGLPLSSEFTVNEFSPGDQSAPSVAMDPSGTFVVAWQSFGQEGDPLDYYYGIYARSFDSNGIPLGEEVQINTTSEWTQMNPDVSVNRDGDLVIVWESYDGASFDVLAQLFDSSGEPIGEEFTVNQYSLGFQWRPAVSFGATNSFAVAWDSIGQDGDGDGIFSRCYSASCAAAVPQPPSTSPTSPSKGGGGSFDLATLAILLALGLRRRQMMALTYLR